MFRQTLIEENLYFIIKPVSFYIPKKKRSTYDKRVKTFKCVNFETAQFEFVL